MKKFILILLTINVLTINAQNVNEIFENHFIDQEVTLSNQYKKVKNLNNLKTNNNEVQFLENRTIYSLDNTLGFIQNQKLDYTLNEDIGKLSGYNNYLYDTDEMDWQPFVIEEYSYNDNELLSEMIYRFFSPSTGEPFQPRKYYYTYNDDNQLTLIEENYWEESDNTETPFRQYIHIYNNEDQLIEITENLWNTDSSIWENYKKDTFEYDANGFETLDTEWDWEELDAEYRMDRQTETTNLPSGQPTELIRRDFDSGTLELENNYSQVYSYNADNSRNNLIRKYYDSDTETFVNFYIQNYEWDTNLTYADLLVPTYSPQFLNYKLLNYRSYLWDESAGDFSNELYREATYNYTPVSIVSSIEALNQLNISIYPNPFVESINIENVSIDKQTSLHIYNSNGQVVYSTNKLTDTNVNLPRLTTGIYYYKVKNEEGIATGSLIKK